MKKQRQDNEHSHVARAVIEDSRYLSRRAFLVRSGTVLTATTVVVATPFSVAKAATTESANQHFSEAEKSILSAVTEHLFPHSPDSPGAIDVHAVAFIETVIFQPDFAADRRDFIIKRIQSLQDSSRERFDRAFDVLDDTQKESLLRYLADHTRWGRNWLRSLLAYILEAVFSDPVYGGNPDGIGWRWLDHQPGFPRPPADKVYYKLGYGSGF